MHRTCPRCDEDLTGGLCRACGPLLFAAASAGGAGGGSGRPPDPLVGRVISDRYEILELLSDGGMARLYRGIQRSLERPVAIKMIHPDLLGSDPHIAEEVVARFLVEAKAASRINHPHVIQIIDFGKTPQDQGGHLFQVMELVSGRDLQHVLEEEGPLPIPRVADILRQILAGLGEAHVLGITHRDVKPENVLVESRRGADHIKLIDFGVAKIGTTQGITRRGRIVGSAYYTAPEQARGDAAGPAADLYSVGVLLFEMLTGRVPFDGGTLVATWKMHVEAPRPDPRAVAPDRGISDALAAVCMRALAVDPADRYPDAATLAAAILDAASARSVTVPQLVVPGKSSPPRSSAPKSPSWPPAPPHSAPAGAGVAGSLAELSIPPLEVPGPAPAQPHKPLPRPPSTTGLRLGTAPVVRHRSGVGFVGRDADLTWIHDALADPAAATGVALWGPPGIGRTRLFREASARLAIGAFVVSAQLPAHPRSEVGYSGLAEMVGPLSQLAPGDELLRTGKAASDTWAAGGLRLVFSKDPVKPTVTSAAMRRAACAALRWAAERAVERAAGATVVLVVDDVDSLDGASLLALADLLADEPLPRFKVLMSMVEAPAELPSGRVRSRPLPGLDPEQAALAIASLGGEASQLAALGPGISDARPLHLELLARWRPPESAWGSAARLERFIEWRVRELSPVDGRALQALAILGEDTSEAVSALLERPEDITALDSLEKLGFMRRQVGRVAIAHDLFARVALTCAPSGTVFDMHARAEALVGQRGRMELRAHHAIRGEPDFASFLEVEECARLRAQRGDATGAIDMLAAGMRAARALHVRGEVEAATSAIVSFGKKLGQTLIDAGRHEEAESVLTEVLDRAGTGDADRARIASDLAKLVRRRGALEQADALRQEAIAFAQRVGDTELIARIRANS